MKNSSRDVGIDIVKAISISLILIWHIQPITKSVLPSSQYLGACAWQAVDFFYHYITLLAVPTFICVSLYLFNKKLFLDQKYWKRRLLRLAQIFLFWTSIQFIFYLLAGGGLPLPLKTITGGGPDLPHVGGSVFYFLFVLIKCTFLAFLFIKLPQKIKLFLAIVVIAFSFLYFTLSPLYNIPIGTMSMKNYYLYVPIAYYMVKYPEWFFRLRIFFILGYIVATFYEEIILGGFISAYGRLSILFGALSLISIFLRGNIVSSRPVEFLSKYSLGIFALHKYWLYIFIMLTEAIRASKTIFFLGIVGEKLLLFFATVIFTLASVYLLNKTRMRPYIS